MTHEPAVELRDVRKSFRRHRGLGELLPGRAAGDLTWAIDGVSFRLERGRVLGLAGESGSGKSTLANVLLGLEKPTSGTVLFDGTDLSTLTRAGQRSFRRRVQMVFQDPFASLNPRFTVRRTVAEVLAIHGCPRNARPDRVIAALEQSELRPAGMFLGKYPHELSGGQRQRVAIARAIVLEPAVLVADEPVSMLDVSVRAGILRLLRRLVDQRGMALVFITHDLSLIAQLCDELMVLYRGRVFEFGAATAILQCPRHPYTKQLMAAVPVPDPAHVPATLSPALFDAIGTPTRAGCGFAPHCNEAVEQCHRVIPELREVAPRQRAACHRIEADRPCQPRAGEDQGSIRIAGVGGTDGG